METRVRVSRQKAEKGLSTTRVKAEKVVGFTRRVYLEKSVYCTWTHRNTYVHDVLKPRQQVCCQMSDRPNNQTEHTQCECMCTSPIYLGLHYE